MISDRPVSRSGERNLSSAASAEDDRERELIGPARDEPKDPSNLDATMPTGMPGSRPRRFSLSLAFFTFLFAGVFAAPLPEKKTATDSTEIVARAQAARDRGDFATARRLYEEALAANPRSGRVTLALAETLIDLKEFEAAEKLLVKLVQSVPNRPEPRLGLCRAYLKTGKARAALAEAEKAVALDPKNTDGSLCLGAAFNAMERHAEAVPVFEKALKAHPRDADALHGLATAYAALDDPRAERMYQRLMPLVTQNFPLRLDFVEYLWKVRKYERGNEEMERLLRDAPANPKLRAHYGINLIEQRRFEQAIEELSRALKEGASDYEALFFLGSALLESGRFEEAAERFRQAIALAPDRVPARHTLARVFLLQGKPADAVTELSRASELQRDSASILLDLGRAHEAAGDVKKAEEAYRRALELQSDLSQTHYFLGTLLARQGRSEEARNHIELYRRYFESEQKKRFETGSRQAELNLGWTHLRRNRFEKALAQFQRHPDDAEALRGAAAVLSRLGRYSEAAKALERALLLSPDDHRLRYALDQARERAGKT